MVILYSLELLDEKVNPTNRVERGIESGIKYTCSICLEGKARVFGKKSTQMLTLKNELMNRTIRRTVENYKFSNAPIK